MPDGNNVDLRINLTAKDGVTNAADSASASLVGLSKQVKLTQTALKGLTKEYRVKVNTSEATRELVKLKSQAESIVRGTTSTLTGRSGKGGKSFVGQMTSDFGDAKIKTDVTEAQGLQSTNFNSPVQGVKEFKNAIKDVSAESSKASAKTKSWLGNLTSSLRRIVKLRLLRGIIRSITTAISEGSKNIYEYSTAMNSTDASGFANRMNQVASAFLYVKNSIGAVIAPIMNTLSPVLTWIAEKFVAVSNIVAQFFAALGGQSTYTRAKYVETAWQGVADSTGDATANAKEYKRTIMGFDELNVLDSQDDGSGGGGSGGGGGGGASDMFEEAPLETTGLVGLLNSLAKLLSPVLAELGKQIDGFVETSTGVINGGIDVVMGHFTGNKEQVVKGFDEMQEAINKDNIFAKFAQWTYTAWKDIADFFVKIKIGVLDAFIWITDKMSFLDPVLEALGMPTFKDANERFKKMRDYLKDNGDLASNMADNMERWAKGEETSEEMLKKNASLFSGLKNLPSSFSKAWSTFKLGFDKGVITPIKNGWEGIKGFVSKNVIEPIKLAWNSIGSFFNKNVIEPIKNAWEKVVTFVDKSVVEPIKKTWEKIVNFFKTSIIKPIQDLWTKVKDFVRDNVVEPIKKIWEKIVSFIRESVVKPVKELWKGVKTFIDEHVVEPIKTIWEKIVKFIDKNVVTPIKETWKTIKTFIKEKIVEPIENLWEKIVGFIQKNVIAPIESAWEGVKTFVDTNVVQPIAGFWNGLVETISGIIGSIETAISNAWSWIYWNVIKPFSDFLDGVKNTWDYLFNNGGSTIHISASGETHGGKGLGGFANGGYVDSYAKGGIIPRFANGGVKSAEIFAANENGVPELIGRIGNRPAVANQGQMVDALSEALYRGLSQMFSQESTNEVNVYMDSTRVARAVEKGKRTMNRRFNVALV